MEREDRDRPTAVVGRALNNVDAADALRYRHDGFTPGKQRVFLDALKETGCVEDACRAAGISDTSAYRTRRRLPDFARRWNTALAMASTTIEMIAFERATVGADKTIIRQGKVVQIERRPSDVILRAIMQNVTRGREAAGRETMKKELKRDLYEEQVADEPRRVAELTETLLARIRKVREGRLREHGYTIGAQGHAVPPGYRLVPTAPDVGAARPGAPRAEADHPGADYFGAARSGGTDAEA